MKRMLRALLAATLIVLAAAQPAVADLPDPVLFRVRLELGDVAQVREWLAAGLSPEFMGDQTGTGLMIAAWEGNVALMEVFVTYGADINKTNALGEQALLHAAWRGNLDAVKWLVEHGAQLNREPPSWTALHYAVFAGREQVAQYLIERGADINARSTNGSTPLMMAAYEGREQLARRLIALGADTGVKNDHGEGVLEWAMKHREFGIARMVSDRQQFAAAASLPKESWGEPVRSVPVDPAPDAAPRKADAPLVRQKSASAREIERLLDVRNVLAAKGMTSSVTALDRQIAALRAKREPDSGSATTLEISASRSAPRNQQARLVTRKGAKPSAPVTKARRRTSR
jgi:hypothetical protein